MTQAKKVAWPELKQKLPIDVDEFFLKKIYTITYFKGVTLLIKENKFSETTPDSGEILWCSN